MDIRELNQLFQQSSYQDYTLAEYQFLRRFMDLTKPGTITCVGGYTNLDLFYSCQAIAPRVVNWDSGAHLLGLPMGTLRESHQMYQRLTRFQGTYEWVSQTVKDLREVGQQELLWLGGHQDGVYELGQWPRHVIFGHHGKMKWAQAMRHVHDHVPLVAMGRNIAVFSVDSWHSWEHHTYLTVKSDFMDIRDIQEIVS
tara:strand:- start:48 stop:638 length:591 start_codon:yes stop_codon:yes gene_type:complete